MIFMVLRFPILIVFVLFGSTLAFGQVQVKKVRGILIDNTGSMATQLSRVKELAKEIVRQSDDQSAVSIFGFAPEPSGTRASLAKGVQCVNDKNAINGQVESIVKAVGQTALVDAIQSAAGLLKSTPACQKADEVSLVVISDGEDRNSLMKWDDLFKGISGSNVRIFAIGLIDELGSDTTFIGKPASQKSKDALRKLTSLTGGTVIFPKKKDTAEEIVMSLFSADESKSKK